MTDLLRDVTLFAATLATGLVAGLFYAYSISVMLGLRRTDDRTFVIVMQRINDAILNGWFALAFVGAPVTTTAAAVLHLTGAGRDPAVRAVLAWVLLAWVLYGVALAVTFSVNVPLNNRLARAAAEDATAARRNFEQRWVRWNVARTFASTASFGCLVWALT